MTCLVSMMPFEKSSKCSVIDRYVVMSPITGPDDSANQPTIQNIRNTTKVMMPATIWLLVVLEISRPIDRNAPPISSRPRYDATSGRHSGLP